MIARLIDAASRRRWPLTILAFVVLILPLIVVRPEGEGSRITATAIVLAALAFAFLVVVNLSGRDPDADDRARDVAPDALSAALFARWMRRSKHFRFVGGLTGGILGLAFADGSLIPALIGLLAGIALGGAAAEIHSIGGRNPSSRSADIAVRRLRDYVTQTDTIAMAVIAAGALIAIAAALLNGAARTELLWAGATGLSAIVATAVMQWAVVVRRRPALSADLRRADDLMRRLAATQGFTRPAIAFALLVLGQGLAAVGNSAATGIGVLVLWTLAFAWYVASRQNRQNVRALISS